MDNAETTGAHPVDETMRQSRDDQSQKPYRYKAFISYSHSEDDAEASKDLHAALERLRVPRSVATSSHPFAGHIFRDKEELPAGPDLNASILTALEESEFLIVVCSPRAAESYWVRKEVQAFIELHGRDHVLAAIIDGEPAESFPPELLEPADDKTAGQTPAGSPLSGPPEPLAADLRPGKTRTARKAELLRLAAPLLDCPYEKLAQRRRKRQRRIAAVLAAAACAVAAIIAWRVAVHQSELRAEETNQMAEEAMALGDEGYYVQSVQLAAEALRSAEAEPGGAFPNEERRALEQALGVYSPDWNNWTPCYGIDVPGVQGTCAGESEGWFAIRSFDTSITTYDTRNGTVVSTMRTPEADELQDALVNDGSQTPQFSTQNETFGTMLCPANGKIICESGSYLLSYDVATGDLIWARESGSPLALAATDNERSIAVLGNGSSGLTVLLVDAETGEAEATFNLESGPLDDATLAAAAENAAIAFSGDGSLMAVAAGESLYLVDTGTGATTEVAHGLTGPISLDFRESTLYAAGHALDAVDRLSVLAVSGDDGSILWQRTDYDSDIDRNTANIEVSVGSDALEEDPVEVVAGSQLLLLDKATGDELYTFDFDSDAVGFMDMGAYGGFTAISANGSRYIGEVYDGEPYFDAVETGDGVGCFSQPVSEVIIVHANGYPHFIGISTNGSSVFTYRMGEKPFGYELILDSAPNMWANSNDSLFVCSPTDGILYVYDAWSLEVVNTVDLTYLFEPNPAADHMGYRLSDTHPDIINVMITPDDGSPRIHAGVNAVTGEVMVADRKDENEVFALEWNGRRCSFYVDKSAEDYALTPRPNDYIVTVFDTGTYSPIATICARQSEQFMADAVATDSRILLQYMPAEKDDPTLAFYTLDTGEQLDADIASYAPAISADSSLSDSIVWSRAENLIILACSDGVLRAFDAQTGNLKWELPEDLNPDFLLVMSPDGKTLFLQDGRGRCSLIDVRTGKIAAADSEELPAFLFAHFVNDGELLYAVSKDPEKDVFIVWDCTRNNFAVSDEIPHGRGFVTLPSGQCIVFQYNNETYVLPYYSNNELLALADTIVAVSSS